jgi:hypothetical protein
MTEVQTSRSVEDHLAAIDRDGYSDFTEDNGADRTAMLWDLG